MSFVRIQPITDSITCQAGESIECAFDVINTTEEAIKIGAEPIGELAVTGQVKLKGPAEIDLPAGGQEKVLVSIQIPAEAKLAEGEQGIRRAFSLRVYKVRDVEQNVESKTIGVDVVIPEVVTPPPGDDRPKPKWGLIIGAIIGGIVLLAGGGTGIYFLVSGGESVPNVVDLIAGDATDILGEANLTAEITETVSDDGEPGVILSQDPAAGEDVPENGVIALVMEQVSAPIPDVIGLTAPAAIDKLTAAGLALGEKTFERGGQHPGGAVIAQNPAPGSRALPGQSVDITIEQEIVQVPRLAGMTYATAKEVLASSGLVAAAPTTGKGDGTPGSVIDQNPSSGEAVDRGSVVEMTIKEKTIKIPNVAGKTVESAIATLTRAGLKLNGIRYTRTTNRRQSNRVSGQSPAAGAEAYIGSDASLTVARMVNVAVTTKPPKILVTPGKFTIAKLSSSTACASAVNGKIAWDYKNSKTWNPANVARLCKGAESTPEPARCFSRVMFGGIEWQKGATRWNWDNAVKLCSGATNANARVRCFSSQRASGKAWSSAISACNKTVYRPTVARVRNVPATTTRQN